MSHKSNSLSRTFPSFQPLTQAISRRDFSPQQCEAVVKLTTNKEWGTINLIEKYTAGNFNYTLTRSKYGQKNVTTVTNRIKGGNNFFSNTGCPLFKVYLILVDPEKKARLERDVERFEAKCRQIAAEKREKEVLVKDLEDQLDQLDAEKVHSLYFVLMRLPCKPLAATGTP